MFGILTLCSPQTAFKTILSASIVKRINAQHRNEPGIDPQFPHV